MLLTIWTFFRAFNSNCKNGMGPGAMCVHIGCPNAPVAVTLVHELVHVVGVVHRVDGEVLDVHALAGMLFDFKSDTLVFAKKVAYFFIVDFQIGDFEEEFEVIVGLCNVAENVRK